jgi:hypothetical protein
MTDPGDHDGAIPVTMMSETPSIERVPLLPVAGLQGLVAGQEARCLRLRFLDLRDPFEDRRVYRPEGAVEGDSTGFALDPTQEEGCVWNGGHGASQEGGLGRVRIPPAGVTIHLEGCDPFIGSGSGWDVTHAASAHLVLQRASLIEIASRRDSLNCKSA